MLIHTWYIVENKENILKIQVLYINVGHSESKGGRIISLLIWVKSFMPGFPGGAVVENLPANAGDTGSSPGLGRSHMPRSN